MPKTRIHYLFPTEVVHDLPTWRFRLHFKAPTWFRSYRTSKAMQKLNATQFEMIDFECDLARVAFDPEFRTIEIPIQISEEKRKQKDSLQKYESEFWRLYAILIGFGFGDVYYEAVDWHEPEEDGDTNIQIKLDHPASKRSAIFEDDGRTGYLYLTEPESMKPVASAFVYSRVANVTDEETCEMAHRGEPPVPMDEFVNDSAMRTDVTKQDVSIAWGESGETAVLSIHNEPCAMVMIATGGEPGKIRDACKNGYSKCIKKEGIYGKPWDENIFNEIFAMKSE